MESHPLHQHGATVESCGYRAFTDEDGDSSEVESGRNDDSVTL
jgi:hypothetical protein